MDYANIFLFDYVMELSKNININEYTIKLIEGKQLLYGLIYSLGLVKLKTLKIYIENYLKTGFIWPSKSPIDVFILFNQKLDRSFYFYINYRGLNNLIIKN